MKGVITESLGSFVSWIFWLEGGDNALLRLGDNGVKGVWLVATGFERGGACSTPSRIGDLGDLGGVELEKPAVLNSRSSTPNLGDGDVTNELMFF